ncbi:unnamed protein product [Choristocarpus tenellus]
MSGRWQAYRDVADHSVSSSPMPYSLSSPPPPLLFVPFADIQLCVRIPLRPTLRQLIQEHPHLEGKQVQARSAALWAELMMPNSLTAMMMPNSFTAMMMPAVLYPEVVISQFSITPVTMTQSLLLLVGAMVVEGWVCWGEGSRWSGLLELNHQPLGPSHGWQFHSGYI